MITTTIPFKRRGETQIVGDDDTYVNHFHDKNPTAFFGFSSLRAFVDHVAALKRPTSNGRNHAWATQDAGWFGTSDLPTALELARSGWREGLEGLIDLDIPPALVRRRASAIAGGAVNVGRMLSGDPKHMTRRAKQPGRRIITLFIETFMSSGVEAENAIIRARLIAAISDHMERQGYSCEIVAVVTTKDDNQSAGHQHAIALKAAGERMNLLDIIFALGHPSFFRRLVFASVGACDQCRSTWQTQGWPSAAFNVSYPTAPNEFYIKQLSLSDQARFDNDQPLTMLPLIKPANLEITPC